MNIWPDSELSKAAWELKNEIEEGYPELKMTEGQAMTLLCQYMEMDKLMNRQKQTNTEYYHDAVQGIIDSLGTIAAFTGHPIIAGTLELINIGISTYRYNYDEAKLRTALLVADVIGGLVMKGVNVPDVELNEAAKKEIAEADELYLYSIRNGHKLPGDEWYQSLLKMAADSNIPLTYTRGLDIVNDADIILDIKRIRQSLPSGYKTSGNVAIAEVNIEGISKNKYFSHSSIDKMKDNLIGKADDFSLQPENPMFKAIKAPNKNGEIYLRESCTEYKILNDIANRLKDNVNAGGKIKLVTELEPCDSCKNVINNFRSTFKNIEIEVIHNNDIRIIPKNGY